MRKSGVENTLFVIYKGSANSIMKHAEDFEIKEEEKTPPMPPGGGGMY